MKHKADLSRNVAKKVPIVDDLNPEKLQWPTHRWLFQNIFRLIWKMGETVMAECKLCKDSKAFRSNLAISPMSFSKHLQVSFHLLRKM